MRNFEKGDRSIVYKGKIKEAVKSVNESGGTVCVGNLMKASRSR